VFDQAPKSVRVDQIRVEVQDVTGVPSLDPYRRVVGAGASAADESGSGVNTTNSRDGSPGCS
jgi:hypothetical protein